MNYRSSAVLFVFVLVVVSWPSDSLATKFWKNGVTNGNWNTGNNWSATSPAGVDNGSVPVAGEPVRIVHTDGTPRNVTLNTVTPSVGLVSVDLTGSGTGSDFLFINAGANLTAGALFAGGHNGVTTTNGRGIVSQSGGTVSMSAGGDLVVGHGAGSNGLYALTGGTLNASQSEFIGISGTGIFNHSGGTNTIAAGAIGAFYVGNAGGNGTYNLTNTGRLESYKSEYIGTGAGGVGNFHQTGGTNVIRGAANNLYIGDNGATGTYILSGTSELYVDGSAFVGNSGTGTLTIQQQSLAYIADSLNINATSTVNLNGGRLRFQSGTGLNRINYTAGTIELYGDRVIGTDAIIATLFPVPTIPAGKKLDLEGGLFAVHKLDTTLRVEGGAFETGGELFVGDNNNGALLIQNGGMVKSEDVIFGQEDFTSYAIVGSGGTWISSDLYIGGFYEARIDLQAGGSITNLGKVFVGPAGTFNLQGGSLRTYEIAGAGDFNFDSGTIAFTGSRVIGSDPSIIKAFGGQPHLTSGKALAIDDTATLLGNLTIDGGALSVGQIANGQFLQLHRGALNILSQAITIGPAGPLGAALDLNDDMIVNVALGTTNSGLIIGDGEISGSLVNAAAGELRAEPGKSLKLTGANNSNAGQINLLGGLLEYTQSLTNNTSGFISGNGTLKTSSLANNGVMNFSGLMNIAGDVTNNASAKIISSGGGPTTFHDDVINNGEIRTSTGSFTTFFGAASGSGIYTGAGTVNFEGDLKPGNSPAAVTFGGDVSFGPNAAVRMELGGTAPGSGYDQLLVTDALALDGSMQVSLINGYSPSVGQSFNLFDSASVSGTFDSLSLPALSGGLSWNTSQLYITGVLSVVSAGLAGDFNVDGFVDGADLVNWKANFGAAAGATHMQGDADGDADVDGADFLVWQRQAGGSPTSVDSTVAVPEPASLLIIGLASLAALIRPTAAAQGQFPKAG